MWETQTNTLNPSLNRLISRDFSISTFVINWRKFFFHLSLIMTGAIVLFLIVLIKSKTTEDFLIEPYFFTYTLFVTIFTLSRIFSAMLYRKSLSTLTATTIQANQSQGIKYEPTVAFVIPCMNEEDAIGDAIIKCYQIDYPREKLEVIVVNDGSTDRTLVILQELQKYYPNLRIIDWPNQGKRWAMAAGFQVSNSEIVIQLDSDSHVDPTTFHKLIEPFQNQAVAAVCANGIPKNADTNIITRMQTAYYFMSFNILKAAESTFDTVFCCSGCCSAYRKSSVMPVLYHWLGERCFGLPVTWGDDRALTSWLIKQGGKTVYSDQSLAYTVVPSTWRQLFKQQLRWKKSWIINAILSNCLNSFL